MSDAITARDFHQADGAEDWRVVRSHPAIGARMVEATDFEDIRSWILAHHERPDGLGYPEGRAGEELPVEARILAVADAYEAMTADRPYRAALAPGDAARELRRAAGGWLSTDPSAQIALMGDWNIAPQDEDVWDMAEFAESTHVSAPERDAFRAIVEAGFTDVARAHTPGPGVYTYWDYQQLSFPKRHGMRIDFVLGSPALSSRVKGAAIDREERKGKGASDHAPVIVELADV